MLHKILFSMSRCAANFNDALSRWLSAWRRSEAASPLEGILQPSTGRLKAVGTFILIAQPLTAIAWALTNPQPYDNFWLRCFLGLSGLLLVWRQVSANPESDFAAKVATFVFWIELPLFGFWMYFCNGGNNEWFVSLCCMVLIYYHLTDWRIASGGVVGAGIFAWTAKQAFDAHLPIVPDPPYGAHAMLFMFCWGAAITLGASAANLRREHFRNTLHAMVVLAQGMREPITTVGAIANKMNMSATQGADLVYLRGQCDRLSSRLHELVRTMQNRLDTHISNASISLIVDHDEQVSAYEVLNEVVGRYPYANAKERACVCLIVEADFDFRSSFSQFAQAIDNLLKNSFKALERKGQPLEKGDITILVTCASLNGVIDIRDSGTGIPADVVGRVFEPFFTTSGGTGLGLGLNFTQKVISLAGGKVSIDSVVDEGTLVSIQIPRNWKYRTVSQIGVPQRMGPAP